jgi:hypothetical protein
MWLMLVYVGITIVLDFLDYLVGVAVESYSEPASLPVFLTMYFLSLWAGWVIAVKLTEPKKADRALAKG